MLGGKYQVFHELLLSPGRPSDETRLRDNELHLCIRERRETEESCALPEPALVSGRERRLKVTIGL